MGSSGKSSRAETFLLILKANLKRCLHKPSKPLCNSQLMASQVVEQQSRHGGGFVWRAGVGYQYQGGQQQQAQEQWGKVQQGKERGGQFTQGLGWEHFYTSSSPSS